MVCVVVGMTGVKLLGQNCDRIKAIVINDRVEQPLGNSLIKRPSENGLVLEKLLERAELCKGALLSRWLLATVRV